MEPKPCNLFIHLFLGFMMRNHKINRVYIDNKSWFVFSKMRHSSIGVYFTISVPYTSECKNLLERKTRIFLDAIRSMS